MTPSESALRPASLIDVHSHFLPDEYIAGARAAGVEHPDGMPRWPSWSVEEHLRLMDEWGIERAILSISSPGTNFGDNNAARALTRRINQIGAQIAQQRPDRFGHFASLPLPDVEGALREVPYVLDELGSDGVVLLTNSAGVYLGSADLAPLYDMLNRRRAVTFVHPTSPPHADELYLGLPRAMLEFIFDTTRTVSDLLFTGKLASYSDIRWIFTHGGGALPLLSDRMQAFRDAGFVADTGPDVLEQLAQLWFDMAGTPFPRQIPALIRAVGSQRVLYGSDSCFTPPATVATQLQSIADAEQPGPDTWSALTTRNAELLLSRDLTSPSTRKG